MSSTSATQTCVSSPCKNTRCAEFGCIIVQWSWRCCSSRIMSFTVSGSWGNQVVLSMPFLILLTSRTMLKYHHLSAFFSYCLICLSNMKCVLFKYWTTANIIVSCTPYLKQATWSSHIWNNWASKGVALVELLNVWQVWSFEYLVVAHHTCFQIKIEPKKLLCSE